jgi:biopolymer transport protein ExbD
MRLASRFGQYGYRQITNLLRIEGWQVNYKRVERIWRQEVSANPQLIAAVKTHPDADYRLMVDVLDALKSADTDRISL